MQFSSEADVQAIVERAQAKTQRARAASRAALRRLDVMNSFADEAAARLEKVQAMPIRQALPIRGPLELIFFSESSNERTRSDSPVYSRQKNLRR